MTREDKGMSGMSRDSEVQEPLPCGDLIGPRRVLLHRECHTLAKWGQEWCCPWWG